MTWPKDRTPEHDAATVGDGACTGKDASTLIAQAALAGVELRMLADGRWLVIRWNLTRELADAAAVREFLAQVGVRA